VTVKIIPAHGKIWIPMAEMTSVPPGFEETWMGEPKGAIAQYRGPDNLHLLKYKDGWELHRDFGDPRSLGGFIIHIFLDAPEVGLALLTAAGRFREIHEETRSVWTAIGAAIETGILTYVGFRLMKELIGLMVKWTANAYV
jgi:hypothetical protein